MYREKSLSCYHADIRVGNLKRSTVLSCGHPHDSGFGLHKGHHKIMMSSYSPSRPDATQVSEIVIVLEGIARATRSARAPSLPLGPRRELCLCPPRAQ